MMHRKVRKKNEVVDNLCVMCRADIGGVDRVRISILFSSGRKVSECLEKWRSYVDPVKAKGLKSAAVSMRKQAETAMCSACFNLVDEIDNSEQHLMRKAAKSSPRANDRDPIKETLPSSLSDLSDRVKASGTFPVEHDTTVWKPKIEPSNFDDRCEKNGLQEKDKTPKTEVSDPDFMDSSPTLLQCPKEDSPENAKTSPNVPAVSKRSKKIGTDPTDWKCDRCDIPAFTSLREYRKHRRSHLSTLCPICGILLKDSCASTVKKHIGIVHFREKRLECEICQQKFAYAESLYAHQAREHKYKAERVHQPCQICGKVLTSRCGLRQHLLQVHNYVRDHYTVYPCSLCDKKFILKSKLRDHMNVHEGIKPFSCPFCPLTSGQFGYLKQHAFKVHGKVVKRLLDDNGKVTNQVDEVIPGENS
ncbi:unnamed protein product [Notodromas monacha]|uniref:C2H2-type domain-containing protein n=1 Tax=Notodromas monacha TaxID=399045 RepID=A0A7R9BJD2_9CRUS|nr:unnamed protein product [Notodromas monacha]CAG0915044.1 unnamed protein product [Notodromas monacha]